MPEIVKIKKVYVSDKDKSGKEFVSKKGTKFKKVAIKTEEYPEIWFSKLVFKDEDPALKLKEGDTPNLKLTMSGEGGYHNFDFPDEQDEIMGKLNELEERIAELERITSPTHQLIEKKKAELDKMENLPF